MASHFLQSARPRRSPNEIRSLNSFFQSIIRLLNKYTRAWLAVFEEYNELTRKCAWAIVKIMKAIDALLAVDRHRHLQNTITDKKKVPKWLLFCLVRYVYRNSVIVTCSWRGYSAHILDIDICPFFDFIVDFWAFLMRVSNCFFNTQSDVWGWSFNLIWRLIVRLYILCVH